MKSKYLVLAIILVAGLLFAGCGQQATTNVQVPTLKVAYTLVDHHAPLIVAAKKGDEFKNTGTYLKPVVDKEKYELISDGKKIANIELVVTKSGAEAATLFAQKHIDIGMLSITAAMSGIDSGAPIKVLSPMQSEGLALVSVSDNPLNGWDDFIKYLDSKKEPVKIGYHSPTSAPLMVFEGALKKNNIAYTRNPNDMNAKILLVDLKDASNLIPSLASKQVDGWVGPSPQPQVAEAKGVGKIVLDLRDLPPHGAWHDAPCCAIAARTDVIEQNQEIITKFLKLMTYASDYSNKNHDEYAAVVAQWIGIPVEAAKASTSVYKTEPTATWLKNSGVYVDLLNEMNKFKGPLKGQKLEAVSDTIFDFRMIKKAQAELSK